MTVSSGEAKGILRVLTQVLHELRRDAVDGTVTREAFEEVTAHLRLAPEAGERVIAELSKLGLRVLEPAASQEEESAPAWLEQTLELMRLYTDGDVTPEVAEGFADLVGLTAEERVRLPRALAEGGIEVRAAPRRQPVPKPVSVREPQPVAPAPARDTGAASHLEAAVTVARQVIARDRTFRRQKPEVLTAQQEIGLWVLFRGADSLDVEPSKADVAALPPDDVRRHAFDTFVLHNVRLVHKNVQAYQEQGLEYEDLVQEGVLGLMTAVRKFDGSQGNKFSTYATWWIRQAVTRAIADQGSAIRIPVHMHENMRKVAAAEARLRGEGRAATLLNVAGACGLPLATVEAARKLSKVTDSLDRAILDGVTLGEHLDANTPVPGPEGVLFDKWSREAAEDLLALLKPKEADILRRRVGLDDDPETLEAISADYGVTRERIRQIEARAIKFLRERLSPPEKPAPEPKPRAKGEK